MRLLRAAVASHAESSELQHAVAGVLRLLPADLRNEHFDGVWDEASMVPMQSQASAVGYPDRKGIAQQLLERRAEARLAANSAALGGNMVTQAMEWLFSTRSTTPRTTPARPPALEKAPFQKKVQSIDQDASPNTPPAARLRRLRGAGEAFPNNPSSFSREDHHIGIEGRAR